MWNSLIRRFRAAARRTSGRLQRLKERLLLIPAVQLVARTMHELDADDASHMAAGVAYYAILSLFPLLLGLIAILGFFLPAETFQEQLFDFFESNMPGSIDVLEQNIEDVIRLRGAIGVVSIVLLLWSASAMFGAVGRAINRAWDVHENRPFHIRKLRDMGMALGTGVLFLLSLGATSALSILHGSDLPFVNVAAEAGARVLGFAFSLGIFLGLYKVVPNTKTYWRYVWPGALLGAALFEVAKSLFVLYLGRFASYESVYGSVASVIVLLVWIFLSAFILLVGAEFSAEYGRMRRGVERGTLIAEHMKGVESSDAGTKRDVEETGGQTT